MAAPTLTGGPDAANTINAWPDGSQLAYSSDPTRPISSIRVIDFNRGAPAGSLVKIRGNNFSTVTAVTFGNIPAAFTIISPTEIHATVPAGPASTKFTVTNPDGSVTGTFTKYFWKDWEQPPDQDTDMGNQTIEMSFTSTNVLQDVLPVGSGAPDFDGPVQYPDNGGTPYLRVGESVLCRQAEWGTGNTVWTRQIGFGVIELDLHMGSPGATDSELSDFRSVGYQNEDVDGIGVLVSDLVFQFQIEVADLDFADNDPGKTAAPVDFMTGNVQLRRVAPEDWEWRVLSPEFANPNPQPVLTDRAWPDGATMGSWPVLAEQDITEDKAFWTGADDSFLYMTEAVGTADEGNWFDFELTFHPEDFDDSATRSRVYIPLALVLDRFVDEVLITEPNAADPDRGAEKANANIGGSWFTPLQLASWLRSVTSRLWPRHGTITYRPCRYRLLVTEPNVPSLDSSMVAGTRTGVALRPLLHIPFVPGAPTDAISSNNNFADRYALPASTSGSVVFDITGANTEEGETYIPGDGHTVWFTWTAPVNGTAHFTTSETPAPRWDSTLAIFDNVDPDVIPSYAINGIVSDDDGELQPGVTTPDGYGTSGVTFACVAGETYRIQVDSYDYDADPGYPDTPGTNPSAGYPRTDCVLRWSVT